MCLLSAGVIDRETAATLLTTLAELEACVLASECGAVGPDGSDNLADMCFQELACFDPEADAALFEALEATVTVSENRQLVRCPHHINDAEFAAALVAAWRDIFGD